MRTFVFHTRRTGGGSDLSAAYRRVAGLDARERSPFWSTPFVGLVLTLLGISATTADVLNTTNAPSLGKVDFAISCSGPAQAEFNRGVALLHHMTYPQARAAFERVTQIDPQCAMAHWGIAMTLFQPMWSTRPGPAELRRGWDELRKARALGPPTKRERLFVDAAEAFFQDPASSNYWARILRWEQAMKQVHTAYPQDVDAVTFYALAHLAAAPADESSPKNAELAAKLLRGVVQRNPDHPGAIHYLVHANDVRGREREDFEVICGYEGIAPRNPHALHMPTHIYTRLGDWDRVIRGNLLAAEAALAHTDGTRGQSVWDEFPHAIEYLIYAYLQKGADTSAQTQLTRLKETGHLEPTFKTAFHLASTQARYALERHAWAEAMSLVPRDAPTLEWDRFGWPEAVTWFARGIGSIRLGKVDEGRRAATRLQELEGVATKTGEQLFARNIRLLRLEVEAHLAYANGDKDAGIALMRVAAELEVGTPKHPVTPAPTLPAHELLGGLLLDQKRSAEALAAYQRSLELYPKRFNSLLGAARAARDYGDDALASTFYGELLELAQGGTRQSALKEAQAFVAQRKQ